MHMLTSVAPRRADRLLVPAGRPAPPCLYPAHPLPRRPTVNDLRLLCVALKRAHAGATAERDRAIAEMDSADRAIAARRQVQRRALFIGPRCPFQPLRSALPHTVSLFLSYLIPFFHWQALRDGGRADYVAHDADDPVHVQGARAAALKLLQDRLQRHVDDQVREGESQGERGLEREGQKRTTLGSHPSSCLFMH